MCALTLISMTEVVCNGKNLNTFLSADLIFSQYKTCVREPFVKSIYYKIILRVYYVLSDQNLFFKKRILNIWIEFFMDESQQN